MNRFLIYVLLCCPFILNAQKVLDTAVVIGYKITPFIEHKVQIDTNALKLNPSATVGEILQNASSLHIKNYGNNQLATIQFRGTSAQHTKLYWNGLEINNPLLGLSDLSILPSNFISDIEIHYGGASLTDGNGGLGGSVHLNTDINWNKKIKEATLTAGSFNHLQLQYKLTEGNKKWKWLQSSSYQNVKNHFPFYDYSQSTEKPELIIRNYGASERLNMLNQIEFRPNFNNHFKLSFLYNEVEKEILPNLLQTIDSNLQYDENILFNGHWVHYFKKIKTHYILGQSRNKLNFFFRPNEEWSNTSFYTHQQSFIIKRAFKKFTLQSRSNYILYQSNSSNHIEERHQQENINSNIEFQTTRNKWESNIILRQDVIDRNIAPFLYSFSFYRNTFKKQGIRFQVNNNYRAPSLNDLYWNTSGNPNLQAEKAFQLNLSYVFKNLKAHLFSNQITNWIQWIPNADGLWRPQNFKNANLKGIELNHSWSKKIDSDLILIIENSLTITEALDLNTNEILIYTPLQEINSTWTLKNKKLTLLYNFHFTGKRYLSTDNSSHLPWYTVSNINVKFNGIEKEKYYLKYGLQIQNLFNQSYHIVAWYPMPLRNFLIHIQYQIKS